MYSKRNLPNHLQRSSRQVGFLFLSSLVVGVIVNYPLLREDVIRIIALLPAFLTTIYLFIWLQRNLCLNHRIGESQLFTTLGIANWISIWRGSAIILVTTFLPIAIWKDSVSNNLVFWLPGTIYLVAALLDLLDGYIARKQQRITELGRRLDMETDAVGLLAATVLAIFLGVLPFLFLLVGLSYYLYSFGIWLRKKRGKELLTLQYRPYGRIIAGFQMGLVAVVLFPLFQRKFTHIAAYLFMIPFLLGFLRDWLVVSCRLSTDDNQHTLLDSLAESLPVHFFPTFLRLLVLLLCCIYYTSEVSHEMVFWPIAHGFLCLLIFHGISGRVSSLLLIILIAFSHSPFAPSLLQYFIFGSTTLIMLLGTGPYSLWAPEDAILYRRSPTSEELKEKGD